MEEPPQVQRILKSERVTVEEASSILATFLRSQRRRQEKENELVNFYNEDDGHNDESMVLEEQPTEVYSPSGKKKQQQNSMLGNDPVEEIMMATNEEVTARLSAVLASLDGGHKTTIIHPSLSSLIRTSGRVKGEEQIYEDDTNTKRLNDKVDKIVVRAADEAAGGISGKKISAGNSSGDTAVSSAVTDDSTAMKAAIGKVEQKETVNNSDSINLTEKQLRKKQRKEEKKAMKEAKKKEKEEKKKRKREAKELKKSLKNPGIKEEKDSPIMKKVRTSV